MSPEELKAKAQHREVRAFLDGGSWRFRVADVDELARRRGLGSDPELPLSDLDLTVAAPAADPGSTSPSSSSALADDRPWTPPPAAGRRSRPEPDSDHDLLLDDLNVPPTPGASSSSVIIGMAPEGKLPSDSDVRLVPDNIKGASDSDVPASRRPTSAPSRRRATPT